MAMFERTNNICNFFFEEVVAIRMFFGSPLDSDFSDLKFLYIMIFM